MDDFLAYRKLTEYWMKNGSTGKLASRNLCPTACPDRPVQDHHPNLIKLAMIIIEWYRSDYYSLVVLPKDPYPRAIYLIGTYMLSS